MALANSLYPNEPSTDNTLETVAQALRDRRTVDPKDLVPAISDTETLSDWIKEFTYHETRLVNMLVEDPAYAATNDRFNELLKKILGARATTFGGLAWKMSDLLSMLEIDGSEENVNMCRSIMQDIVHLWALGLLPESRQAQPG